MLTIQERKIEDGRMWIRGDREISNPPPDIQVKHIKKIHVEKERYELVNHLVYTLADFFNVKQKITVEWGDGWRCYEQDINAKFMEIGIISKIDRMGRKYQSAVFGWRNPKAFLLHFGQGSVDSDYDNGFKDYKRVMKAFPRIEWGKSGECGLKLLVCHEFAHILQTIEGIDFNKKNGNQIIHGKQFIRLYEKVLELVFDKE